MEQTAIFAPFLALMILTLLVWTYMYVRRIGFIRRERIDARRLEIPGELARLTPAAVSNPSDNLKNLFELPVLFYALALLLFVTNSCAPCSIAPLAPLAADGQRWLRCEWGEVQCREAFVIF
jgi:hypothetical protein